MSTPTVTGSLVEPGDPEYETARMPWSAGVDQRPAAVAAPATAADVAEVVRAAARRGLRVAPQGTGHNAGPLPGLDDVVLLRTSRMTEVSIDPDAGRARVGAGAVWLDVTAPAGTAGLAALHGSSPDVGVTGYSLGGGMGWYARMFGLQTNSVTAVELVTADASLVRADANHEVDLFWALRGGGGNFGVVTALEFALYPIRTAYAGLLAWDWRRAEPVLRRYVEWAATAPETVTTSLRLLQLPPMPQLPEAVRGRQLVVVDGAVLAADAQAERILAPLRELAPEVDTFARVPAPSLVRLHMDPEGPTPTVSGTCTVGELEPAALDALLDAAGPDSGTSLLIAAELRQLGGALARPHPGAGAMPTVDGKFVVFAAGVPFTPEAGAQAAADAARLVAAMEPYANARPYLNFVESTMDVSAAYPASTWERLRAIRAEVDPTGLFVANHAIPAAA